MNEVYKDEDLRKENYSRKGNEYSVKLFSGYDISTSQLELRLLTLLI